LLFFIGIKKAFKLRPCAPPLLLFTSPAERGRLTILAGQKIIFFRRAMYKANLIQKKVVNGWFIRLVSFQGSFLVNAFAPNGGFYSQRFSSVTSASSFFSFFCKKLKSNSVSQSQLSLF